MASLYSESHGFIFAHTPKTAGDSISAALKQFDKPYEGEYLDRWVKHKESNRINNYCCDRGHARPFDFMEILGEEVYGRCFVFTFVRNPWDRMVSSYHYEAAKSRGLSFSDYLQWMRSSFYKDILEGTFWDQAMYSHSAPDVHVYRFETLECDFGIVCEEIGINKPPLPHYNKSERGHYRDYYNDMDKKLVGEVFQSEIELFGYTF